MITLLSPLKQDAVAPPINVDLCPECVLLLQYPVLVGDTGYIL